MGLAPLFIRDAVSRERMAVGPRVISLLVPKKVYTMTPMKEEKRPYYEEKRKRGSSRRRRSSVRERSKMEKEERSVRNKGER